MKNLSIKSAALLFCIIAFSACVVTVDGVIPAGTPMPPPPRPEGKLSTPPAQQSDETSSSTAGTENCLPQGSSPAPSLPETDCMAWNFLHSLVTMTNAMAGKDTVLTEAELVTLETETYPLFVQAQINCGDWLEPTNDYEPITDFLSFLSFTGMDSYGYDTSSLFRHLLEGASKEEFALVSAEIGCTKSFFLLFVEYSE